MLSSPVMSAGANAAHVYHLEAGWSVLVVYDIAEMPTMKAQLRPKNDYDTLEQTWSFLSLNIFLNELIPKTSLIGH